MTDILPLLRAYRAGDDPEIIARAADEIERLRADRDYWCDAFRYRDARRAARAAHAEQEPDHADR